MVPYSIPYITHFPHVDLYLPGHIRFINLSNLCPIMILNNRTQDYKLSTLTAELSTQPVVFIVITFCTFVRVALC